MKRTLKIYFLNLFILFLLTAPVLFAQSQVANPEVSQVFRAIAEISEPSAIQYFIDELFLAETAEETDRIEIIDVSNIGFGTNDVLIFYPSRNVYKIEDYPPELTEQMREWSIEERRVDALNTQTEDQFYPAHADTLEAGQIEESEIELVQNSLIADILVSLDRNYTDMPISFRFERDEEAFIFQMWDYNENAFDFSPRPPGVADSVAVNDFLYVLYSDSTVVADTTMYDIIYLNKTVEETIYTPPVEEISPVIQTQTLPGSNSFPETFDNTIDAAFRQK
ncbi:MAG: hypothetical protein U5K00_15815 [Melioribacteraceae bacterium]|nr:hypothetical protein [Melioribacteraceae bacterium]